MIEVKQVKRKGEVGFIFTLLVAKKKFTCDHVYKSEKSCETAAANFVKRYITE